MKFSQLQKVVSYSVISSKYHLPSLFLCQYSSYEILISNLVRVSLDTVSLGLLHRDIAHHILSSFALLEDEDVPGQTIIDLERLIVLFLYLSMSISTLHQRAARLITFTIKEPTYH